jgi:hypothetical protein
VETLKNRIESDIELRQGLFCRVRDAVAAQLASWEALDEIDELLGLDGCSISDALIQAILDASISVDSAEDVTAEDAWRMVEDILQGAADEDS